jgi:hypothetical protein
MEDNRPAALTHQRAGQLISIYKTQDINAGFRGSGLRRGVCGIEH